MSAVKFHKNNTNFQIANFLAGSCHTPDGAYFMLMELKEHRDAAIANYFVQTKRAEARRTRAKSYLLDSRADAPGKIEAEADLMEIEEADRVSKVLYEAAIDELEFIEHCIAIVKPLCSFVGKGGVSDLEAHELNQPVEWKFELMRRAENYILTSGSIPADEFQTMRMHPAFKEEILPRIKQVQEMLSLPDGSPNLQGRMQLEAELAGSQFNLLEAKN